MLDMGFEPQIRCIMEMVRPDRQTLLFSATFKKRIRELADRLLDAPVHVVVGSIGEASADVHQVVKVLADEGGKWGWLMQTLPGMVDDGEVIIFVSTRVAAEELATNLVKFNFRAASLHGEKQQRERDSIFTDFKKGKVQVLVATDVAARGLDVPTIRNVICFDPARDKDSHTHRIGRTGRAGEQGCAYSLVTQAQPQTASFLVRSLMEVGQPISEDLLKLAEKDGQINQRAPGAGRGAGRGRGGGRGGFGVGSRGGLGGGGRTAGRGRGGGFGLGFKAENPNFEGGGERMASLGLATATGSGVCLSFDSCFSLPCLHATHKAGPEPFTPPSLSPSSAPWLYLPHYLPLYLPLYFLLHFLTPTQPIYRPLIAQSISFSISLSPYLLGHNCQEPSHKRLQKQLPKGGRSQRNRLQGRRLPLAQRILLNYPTSTSSVIILSTAPVLLLPSSVLLLLFPTPAPKSYLSASSELRHGRRSSTRSSRPRPRHDRAVLEEACDRAGRC